MRLAQLVASGWVALALSGCGQVSTSHDTVPVLKIAVLKSGEIRANDKPVSLQQLEAIVVANASSRARVYYYTEGTTDHPPPNGTEVLQLLLKHNRRVDFSSEPCFSDVINEHGKPRTRRK